MVGRVRRTETPVERGYAPLIGVFSKAGVLDIAPALPVRMTDRLTLSVTVSLQSCNGIATIRLFTHRLAGFPKRCKTTEREKPRPFQPSLLLPTA
jgi:hypothetical protein